MIKINLKPMSVNQCWYGSKRPTETFKKYREDVASLLPDDYEVPDGPLFIFFRWGLSNRGNDIDNSCKPFLDCLQNKYGFNDNKVYQIIMDKVIVAKGQEFIEFDIRRIEDIDVNVYDVDTGENIYV